MSNIVIPEQVFDQHIILLGKTRSGKSSAMRYLVEHLLDQNKPVCIVDPKGDWWGIKSSATGKSSGYPVTIFGGEHGDLPLNASSGAVVAELAATENRPSLIDLGGWMPGDRTRFWIDFASAFFRMTRGRRWLAIDEVHNFCPKGKIMDPNAGKMLHWSNRLASEGLGKGVALIAASQRPQKVHNDFLTSCETLVGMRVIHKADRDAIKDWIDACGDVEKGKEVLNTIASRKRGEAWVYSPEISFGPEVVTFPLFKTYDSFKPQDSEHPAKLKGWAEVDLEKIKSKLESVVKEAEANDPAKLRLRIRELEQQSRNKGILNAPAGALKQSADPKVVERAVNAAVREVKTEYDRSVATLHAAQREMSVTGRKLAKDLAQLAERTAKAFNVEIPTIRLPEIRTKMPPANAATSRGARTERADEAVQVRKVHPSADVSSNGDISRRQMDILRVLAEFEAIGRTPVAKNWIAARAGVSNTSGGFFNNLGALRSMGLIEYPVPDTAQLTESGRAKVPAVDTPLNSEELLASCLAILDKRKQDILKAVHHSYPNAIPKPELADTVGVSSTSGGYFNNLGALRSAGMIEYTSDGVKCADWLFID